MSHYLLKERPHSLTLVSLLARCTHIFFHYFEANSLGCISEFAVRYFFAVSLDFLNVCYWVFEIDVEASHEFIGMRPNMRVHRLYCSVWREAVKSLWIFSKLGFQHCLSHVCNACVHLLMLTCSFHQCHDFSSTLTDFPAPTSCKF